MSHYNSTNKIRAAKKGKLIVGILENIFFDNYDFIKILRIALRDNISMRATIQERKPTRMTIGQKVCAKPYLDRSV